MLAHHEKRLNVIHMCCLRLTLAFIWQDKVTNKVLLEKTGIPSLGHLTRMKDGLIPKDLLYGELATGKRPTGRPQLRFKDVCKRDLQALGINKHRLLGSYCHGQRCLETNSKSGVITIRRNTASKSGKEKAS